MGGDDISGSTSDSSDSYTLLNNSDFVTLATTSETGPNGWINDSLTSEFSLGFDAEGTDSFGPGTAHQSTFSFDESGFTTSSYEGSMSFAIFGAYEDLHAEWSTEDYEPDNGSGWSTVSNASTTLFWDYSQSNSFEETENEGWQPSYSGATSSADLTIDDTWSETAVISGNSADGFDSILESTTTCYTLLSGGVYGIGPYLPSTNLLPENATDGSLLQQVDAELGNSEVLVPRYSSGNLYLYDTYSGVYAVPHSVPALLSGSTASLGKAALGLHLAASSPNDAYGFTPYTNAQTPHGLPEEEANALTNMSQDNGPPTGGSQTSTAQPTTVLITLATAGREPADITIPTQAGTQSTGGPAGSGSNLVVAEYATPQGPSMRAAPSEGMIAGAWNSFWNWGTEFFTKDAAVEAEQAIDPVEKLDAQRRNTLWNKLYHHEVKPTWHAFDRLMMSIRHPEAAIQSALTLSRRSLDPLYTDPRDIERNANAILESTENLRDWYNGATDWEKKDFAVECLATVVIAGGLSELAGGAEAGHALRTPALVPRRLGPAGSGVAGANGQLTPNACGMACGQRLLGQQGIEVYQSNLSRGFYKGLEPNVLAQNLNRFQPGWKGFMTYPAAEDIVGLATRGPYIARLGGNPGHFVVVESVESGIVKFWDPAGGVARSQALSDFVDIVSGVVFK